MDDFDLERDLEDAGIDDFEFSMMDEDERREALEESYFDPDMYVDADLDSSFDAWERLQSAGLSLGELVSMDEGERRAVLEAAGLDPEDYADTPAYHAPSAPVQPPVPTPAHPAQPEPRSAPEPKQSPKKYRYLMVKFPSGSQSYAYLTEDRSIMAGDKVMVPVGDRNEPKLAQVVSVGDYIESVVPYPLEKTKSILRKATAEDLEQEALRVQNSEPAATQDDSSGSAPSDEPSKTILEESRTVDPDEMEAANKRKPLLIIIAVLLAIIAAFLGGILFAMHRNNAVEEAPGDSSVQTTSPILPTMTPEPAANEPERIPSEDNVTITTEIPTATPRSTSTPRRTTSTPKPTSTYDPFNARDYSHPDDFYYDYYDDFWDYEDAEDYWEEWND